MTARTPPAAPGPDRPLLRLLGPVEVEGTAAALTSQQTSLLAYLACVGPADRERVVDALWDGRPVSTRRFQNLLSEVRRALGPGHLPEATGGRYHLIGIDTDLDRFQQLAGSRRAGQDGATAGEVSSPTEASSLTEALSLVRGPALSGVGGRHWSWLDRHPELTARAEVAVADAAWRLSSLLRCQGDLDGAGRACERGLACSPLDRPLMVALESIYREQGRPGVASRLVSAWEARLRRLDGEGWAQASSGSAVTTTLPR